jgi:hypothetical protein
VRCRGSGGAPQWLHAIAMPQPPFYADLAGRDGPVVAYDDSVLTPGGMRRIGRLLSFSSDGSLTRTAGGLAPIDWSLDGVANVLLYGLTVDLNGSFTVLLSADANQTLSLGSAIAITDTTGPLLVSYRSDGALRWIHALGDVPANVVTTGPDANVFVAGVLPHSTPPRTVDFGTGAIEVGATDLVIVARFDATGKLVATRTYDSGGSSLVVRSLAVDGTGAIWAGVNWAAGADAPSPGFHLAVVTFPSDGGAAHARNLKRADNVWDSVILAQSASGRIGVAYSADNYALALEVWSSPTMRVWQRISTGAASISPSGLAFDGHDALVATAAVLPSDSDDSQFSPDVGGGALIDGWTPAITSRPYGLLAKYAADGTPIWSKLRFPDGDEFATMPALGVRLAVSRDGAIYIFTSAASPELCGQTIASPVVGDPAVTLYLLKLAP